MAANESSRGRSGRTNQPDLLILGAVGVLVVLGLVIVYSASFATSIVAFDDGEYFVMRQAFWAVIGIGFVFVLTQIDYRLLRAISPLLMLVALVALTAVLVPGIGITRGGAARWIGLGPLPPAQPSEFAKLAVIVYVAAWLSTKRKEDIQNFALGFMPFVVMVGIVAGLVLLEPDTGTALIIVLVTMTLFFVAGASLRHIIALAGVGGIAAFMLLMTEGYRADRIFAFTSAEADPAGRGFHTLQLLIALGSGGIGGLGLGSSRQKFFYVPNSHTDGIFAIIGEEIGFIGAAIVILVFLFLMYRIFRTALKSPDEFGSLLCIGVLSWIGYQMLINIGGITRSIPMTGIPLPFLSYGGSALAAIMAGVGLVLSVSKQARRAPAAVPQAKTVSAKSNAAARTRPLARQAMKRGAR